MAASRRDVPVEARRTGVSMRPSGLDAELHGDAERARPGFIIATEQGDDAALNVAEIGIEVADGAGQELPGVDEREGTLLRVGEIEAGVCEEPAQRRLVRRQAPDLGGAPAFGHGGLVENLQAACGSEGSKRRLERLCGYVELSRPGCRLLGQRRVTGRERASTIRKAGNQRRGCAPAGPSRLGSVITHSTFAPARPAQHSTAAATVWK